MFSLISVMVVAVRGSEAPTWFPTDVPSTVWVLSRTFGSTSSDVPLTSEALTRFPTLAPTDAPSVTPSLTPSLMPTLLPTGAPTDGDTRAPSSLVAATPGPVHFSRCPKPQYSDIIDCADYSQEDCEPFSTVGCGFEGWFSVTSGRTIDANAFCISQGFEKAHKQHFGKSHGSPCLFPWKGGWKGIIGDFEGVNTAITGPANFECVGTRQMCPGETIYPTPAPTPSCWPMDDDVEECERYLGKDRKCLKTKAGCAAAPFYSMRTNRRINAVAYCIKIGYVGADSFEYGTNWGSQCRYPSKGRWNRNGNKVGGKLTSLKGPVTWRCNGPRRGCGEPVRAPTHKPTWATKWWTWEPTSPPTPKPTPSPLTSEPTVRPTRSPTFIPTRLPTFKTDPSPPAIRLMPDVSTLAGLSKVCKGMATSPLDCLYCDQGVTGNDEGVLKSCKSVGCGNPQRKVKGSSVKSTICTPPASAKKVKCNKIKEMSLCLAIGCKHKEGRKRFFGRAFAGIGETRNGEGGTDNGERYDAYGGLIGGLRGESEEDSFEESG